MRFALRGITFILLSVAGLTASVLPADVPPVALSQASPGEVGLSSSRLASIDTVVRRAIAHGRLPGAVVLVGRDGQIAFRKAYGNRSLRPERQKMTTDTLFDLASLTKVVATAPSILLLAERGQLDLDDPVSKYIPDFAQKGKERITIRQLLTHYSGLMADNSIADYRYGYEASIANICALDLVRPPGSRFIYSDVNYILLGEIIRRVSGEGLDDFARKNIFKPLGMSSTGFNPAPSLRSRCAPTIRRDGRWLLGHPHDLRAYLLGGVAGHAGLFSTADDLARYCQMILNRGRFGGHQILEAETVEHMIHSNSPANAPVHRGLGWDIDSPYSRARGTLFSPQSFGHTGYTGTSIWMDPVTRTFVIILSNSVHPYDRTRAKRLRGEVATLVAGAIVGENEEFANRQDAKRAERIQDHESTAR